MTASEYAKPLPIPDEASQEFFDGAKRHELMIQRCKDCKRHISPGRPRCPLCWSTDVEWTKAKGTGKVYTYAVMHQQYHPGFAPDIPYNFAIVELDEGVRLFSSIVDCPNDQIRVNMPVKVTFDDVTADITLPRFQPIG